MRVTVAIPTDMMRGELLGYDQVSAQRIRFRVFLIIGQLWSSMGSMTAQEESLYVAVGGAAALSRLSNTFYDLVLADPILAPVFANFTRDHVEHVAVWLAEVFSGPTRFTEELGGHQELLRAHLGLGITEEQRRRWMELMTTAVTQELPDDPRLHRTVLDYFEWGTTIAKQVSADPAESDLGDPGPTPRWGWGGLI